MKKQQFKDKIWRFFKENERDFAWRRTKTPYKIMLSELMLQQTQTIRVETFYPAFLSKFPTLQSLSDSSLKEVLLAWKGLGYNRRAVNLKRAAEMIVENRKGKFPRTYEDLIALPGIGPGTAGAILNFAFNTPYPFIETNIRTVYLHFFFKDKKDVSDKKMMKLIEDTMDTKNPREWFYALYDYGNHLKKTIGNQNSRSKHYKKQSAFKGSNRELRSLMLSYILSHKRINVAQMSRSLQKEPRLIAKNLLAFKREGII